MPIPGNLLDDNTSGIETSTAGWAATGAVLARVAATVRPDGGTQSLRTTSSSAASAVITTVASVPVTAGTTYLGAMWCAVASRATTITAELLWFDAADAPVGTPAAQSWSLPNSGTVVRRPSVQGVAPAGATKAKLRLTSTNTAGSQVAYWDQAFVGTLAAAGKADNSLTLNEWSSEGPGTAALWTATGATLTRDDGHYIGSDEYADGTTMIRVTPTGAGILSVSLARRLDVVAGDMYRYVTTIALRQDGDTNIRATYRSALEWYDSTDTLLVSMESVWDDTDGLVGQYVSGGHVITETAPPAAAYARLRIDVNHAGTTAPFYLVDHMFFGAGTPTSVVTVYDTDGYVHIEIPPETVQPTVDRISIWRVEEDGSKHPVRGYVGDYADQPYEPAETLYVEDYEAPLGRPVWYHVHKYEAGDLPFIDVFTTPTPGPSLPSGDLVWIKSPGLPPLNTTAMVENPLAWARAARSVTYDIVGRRNPLSVSARRAGRTGSISLLVWDEATHDAFDALLDSGLPLLIQAMPGYGLAGNVYVRVGGVDVEPLSGDARADEWRWTLELAEIDRPKGGLQGSAGRTWQDVYDDFETWDAVYGAYETWADVLTGGA